MNGKVGWIILACVILLLVSLLFCSVSLHISCKNGMFTLIIRYLFLRFSIPFEKAEQKAEKKTGKPNLKESAKKEPFTESVGQIWVLIRAIARDVGVLMGKLRLYDLEVHVAVSGEDAAQAGIRYGSMCAYVYSALAVLQGLMKVRRVGKIQVKPDFTALEEKTDYFFSFVLKLRAGLILKAAFSMAGHYLARFIRKKQTQEEESPEKTEAVSK